MASFWYFWLLVPKEEEEMSYHHIMNNCFQSSEVEILLNSKRKEEYVWDPEKKAFI